MFTAATTRAASAVSKTAIFTRVSASANCTHTLAIFAFSMPFSIVPTWMTGCSTGAGSPIPPVKSAPSGLECGRRMLVEALETEVSE